ncbi:transglutaminaseTgpA domain-containing protein [Brachybacterium tyrofermentans]|uniref:transglutaminaseTgpA domain-containing protein n=1 Tax=Brachybacterium tyrofermentans TaxID=47848 RepID=UPI003FD0A8F9
MSPLMGRPLLQGGDLVGRSLLLLIAILLASAPLSMLLAGSSWFMLTLTASTPVIVTGIVLRQFLRPPLLVPLVQMLVVVVQLVVVEMGHGLVDLGDGPLALVQAQASIFPGAFNELAGGMAPLTLGSRGTVVVMLVLALGALLLDLVFVDLGWHTPVGLALLGSLLIPALQQPSGGAWWTVMGPVVAGLLILATRTVHSDPRYLEGDRRPQAGPLASPARATGAAALCVLLVAALTVPVGLALPKVAPTKVALDMDVINQWQNRDMPSLGPVMIDDDISVRRSLLQQEDVEVLRYSTTADEPSYLRLRTLNSFDGETFRNTAEEGGSPAMGVGAYSDASDGTDPAAGNDAGLLRTEFHVLDLAGDRLPAPERIRGIATDEADISRDLQLKPTSGEIALRGVRADLSRLDYTVLTAPENATADQLRGVDPAVFEQPFNAGYISRQDVPQIAQDLAVDVADEAGADNAFDTAVAYQDYFRSEFAYSLTVNSPPGEDPLESFLADRIGYCEQFAATFALMMTAQGYPTRVAIGFTPGKQDGDEWSVSAKNAHAWPEVWFGARYGWVRFEPTPAAAANGVTPPGITSDSSAAQDEQQPSEEPSDSPTPEEETTPTSEDPTTTEDPEETTDASASDGGGAVSNPVTVKRVESGLFTGLTIGFLVAAGGAAAVVLIRRHRLTLRDERWSSFVRGGGAGDGSGSGGDGGGGAGAGAGGGAGAVDGRDAAIIAERERRRAGELAWSELGRELSVRSVAIRWLGWTGAWSAPPRLLALDGALPPARALGDLLDQIDDGDVEVTDEHRAAAARIASAFTAALYAAPLPETATVGAPSASSSRVAADASPPAPEPHLDDRVRPSGGRDASIPAPTSHSTKAGPGAGAEAGLGAGAGAGAGAGPVVGVAPGEPTPEMPALRRDADLLATLIRNAR